MERGVRGQAFDSTAHGARARAFLHTNWLTQRLAQIPWGEEYEHETGRELFGSNLLALTWIKGEAMPGGLVDEICRGLGLERETDEERQQRNFRSRSTLQPAQSTKRQRALGR